MSQWQPVESAPKDGTLILAFLPESALMKIVFARWDDEFACWYDDKGESAFPIDVEVTHWMPLPEPPEPQP